MVILGLFIVIGQLRAWQDLASPGDIALHTRALEGWADDVAALKSADSTPEACLSLTELFFSSQLM